MTQRDEIIPLASSLCVSIKVVQNLPHGFQRPYPGDGAFPLNYISKIANDVFSEGVQTVPIDCTIRSHGTLSILFAGLVR